MGIVRVGRALFLQSYGGWEATSKWAPSSPGIPYLRRGHQGPERRSGSLKVPVFSASHGDRGQVCPARCVIGHRMLGEARALGPGHWRRLVAGGGIEASVQRVSWTIRESELSGKPSRRSWG